MNPAPIRTQLGHRRTTLSAAAPLTSPALEQIQSALIQQNRDLDAAFSSIANLADVQIGVPADLLNEIDALCTTRSQPGGTLLTLTRC